MSNKYPFHVKPAERPPVVRYVLRDPNGFYYSGHGQAPTVDGSGSYYEAIGESGVPGFETRSILFAVKYGDLESVAQLMRNHKHWCIDKNRPELMDLFDKCEVLETHT